MSEHAAESLNFSDYIEKFDLWKDLTAVQRDELIAHTR